MTLIKSISGIRGTIGGQPGENLTPVDIIKFASAYGQWLKNQSTDRIKVVIGRDARLSGEMVSNLISNTLVGLGIDVIDLGLSTTPTVEIAVPKESAAGGIIVTASHNPIQWNALKLLNEKGEFLSASDGKEIIDLAEAANIDYSEVLELGTIQKADEYIDLHIEDILALPLVNVEAIKKTNFKVAIDAVNSTGGIAIPKLLRALGVSQIEELYCDPSGRFPHNPEPLPEHLTDICNLIRTASYDVGFVVDPDVDRLAIIDEQGDFIGEEYTLVLIADYVLSHTPGAVVSNMSSSAALGTIAEKYGELRYDSAVGEVNVVEKMKEVSAVIGGEGNGGIIYPELHYGRDSLVGIALFLSYLASSKQKVSELKAAAPPSFIAKHKIELTPALDADQLLDNLKEVFKDEKLNTEDGLKIIFGTEWAHIRKSNTEPIIRIYTESDTEEKANKIFEMVKQQIADLSL
ncbi:phosphomannomutase [Reichenbachiella faecimaris]|uniref:Phosphomannomutase n=1 Tax=Reichenbachiella faecimaris TaxID=692418 RepID=A0A1W2GBV8_REIFA|nr:phosphoglucosamine mutase [Reichenbachiella faecimaris]SMD33828.1 phosphomannomutase [Reichenbachiella faecimaris]